MKVLFLDVDSNDFAVFFRKHRNMCEICESVNFYNRKRTNFFRKIIQFIGEKLFEPILYLIYGSWKKRIDEYDCFILPSRKSCKYALKLLKGKKVIVYYWNLITDKEMQPDKLRKDNVMLCTFDEGDAKKYNIQFVDTYYFDLNIPKVEIQSDLFYVGIVRPGREEKLKLIKDNLSNYPIVYDFHIMEYDNIAERLTYEQVVESIQKTKVIVDLTRDKQMGLTLRPLEALQFSKKLLTDNKNIVNYSFYNKQNIFILGADDENDLYNFIKSPYVPVPRELIEKYYFENWLKRIIAL